LVTVRCRQVDVGTVGLANMPADERCTLHFPKEVDDEYITLSGVQPQPPGKTAIISGPNSISRIFALLGEILVRIRVDKRSPSTGIAAQARLSKIESLHTRIVSALAHAPPPLRLGRSSLDQHAFVDGSDSYPDAAFRKATYTELREFFDVPTASRTNASDPFLAMQGNLYVTQQLVRFVIEQYRDELMMSMATAAGDTKATEELMHKQAQDQETVASDILHVLHRCVPDYGYLGHVALILVQHSDPRYRYQRTFARTRGPFRCIDSIGYRTRGERRPSECGTRACVSLGLLEHP